MLLRPPARPTLAAGFVWPCLPTSAPQPPTGERWLHDDLRLDPLETRKATLATLLMRAAPGLRLNEHIEEEDGLLVFHHACKLGLEGIVSKHKDSRYHSGRSRHWIKSKNPLSPTVRREAELLVSTMAEKGEIISKPMTAEHVPNLQHFWRHRTQAKDAAG